MSKSEGQVLDFEKICRLCLLEKRSMSSIFAKKKSDKKVPLPVRIMSCASLELYEGDGLPASICSKCLLSVNQSYAFREQCEQADTTLRQYAQRMTEAGGETSSNRESREFIANDSLAHIKDFGIKIEERHGEEEDCERGVGNLDLNNEKVAVSPIKNIQSSRKNVKQNSQFGFKESYFEYPLKEVTVKEENKSDYYNEIRNVRGESLSLLDTSVVPRIEKRDLKRFESEEGSGILKERIKIINEAKDCDGNVSLCAEKLQSFKSPVLKNLSEVKPENLVVIADVPSVSEDEDSDFGEIGSEDEIGTKINGVLSSQVHATENDKKRTKKSSFENKGHLELLKNLMKNKNIIVKKRVACLPAELLTGTSEEFNSSLLFKKGLSFPYDFKMAQLWKEWEEVNKRIPKVTEIKAEKQTGSETGQEVVPDKDYSSIEREVVGKNVAEENAEGGKSIEGPKGKCKNSKDTVYCKDCRIFLLKSSYGNHIKFVHRKIRKYLCQTCGYAACTGTILRQHVQAVHVGYSFFCDKCPKKFNLMKRLRKHIEMHHSGKPIERNHICQYCGMAFVKPSCLKRHLRSHTQETPYQCQYCERRFKYRWPKKQHERLHTGEKPYKCSFCEERFTQNCVRKVHEYKKHGNEEFKPKARSKEGNGATRDVFRTEESEASRVSCNSDVESS